MKPSQDNNMIDRISAFYVKNDTELLWLIGSGADCDENKIGQLCDWLYKCGLSQKENWATMIHQTGYTLWWKPNVTDWTIVTNQIRCDIWRKLNTTMMWPIVYVRSISKTKMSFRERSDRVQSVIKTIQDSVLIDRIGLVYSKTKTELLRPTE